MSVDEEFSAVYGQYFHEKDDENNEESDYDEPGGYNKAVSPEKVVWYEWDSYFKPLYKSLVEITQFHHFIISTDCVKTKKFADSEEVQSFKLLLKPIDPEMPKVLQPAGLSLERQWYIYHNLRSLVSDISKVDIVAPLPKDLQSKKRKAKTSEDVLKPDEEPGPSSSGSTRKKISRKTTTNKNT